LLCNLLLLSTEQGFEMQIEVISTVEGVEQLKEPWDELYSRSNTTVFMHHSWICKSYKYIPPLEIVLIAVYGNKKKLLGVFPFAIEDFRIKGIKCKVLTGGGSGLSDYCSFLIDPDSNIRLMIGRVIEHLLIMQNERWDYFKYDRLSDKDPTADLFRHLLKKHLYGGDFSSEVTPRVDFHYAYEEAKKVGNVKRRFKKVSPHSSLTHQTGAEIDSSSLAEFCVLHQQSYPDAAFNRPTTQKFFLELIADSSFRENVVYTTIRDNEDIMAAHFGFADAERFYYYVPTYNKKFSDNGPGQYLLWNLICDAKSRNIKIFDFLRGGESYKYNWMNSIATNYTVFAVAKDASWLKKMVVNIWLFNKSLPYFIRSHTDWMA